MGERSGEWHGHRLCVLPPGESWLSGPGRAGDSVVPAESVADERQLMRSAPAAAAGRSWLSAVLLAVLGLAALITIFVAGGSGKVAEPAPLPPAPGKIITALTTAKVVPVQLRVGEYIQLQLPADRAYSTVVEQSSTTTFVIEDLKLPGQQPQLRADNPGHATVEVMSQPVCTAPATCSDQRTLLGTLDVTVTR